jgi:hypothetical protein
MHRMRCCLTAATFALALTPLLAPAAARGDLIRPNAAQAFPDLSGDIVGTQSYSYDPTSQTGIFQVKNTPTLLATGPNPADETYINDPQSQARSQSIQVTLDSQGHLVNSAGNSYSLYGSVTVGGQTFSGLLLQGTPTQFGWAQQNPQAPGMSVYDLNVALTGGLLKQVYGPDAYVRVIAETNSTFANSFTTNFQGLKALTNVRGYDAPGPTPVPEPSTLAVLLAFGGAGLFYRHRRRISPEDLGEGAED